MKTRYIIILIVCTTCTLFCCKDSGTDPDDNGIDTTGQDFVWHIDTIGLPGSYVEDIAIIDENNVWAVGQFRISTPDTNYIMYNAAFWDGTIWNLNKIPVRTFDDRIDSNTVLESVFAFGVNDVWFISQVGSYAHLTSSNIDSDFIWEARGAINKIWGNSSTDIYWVGRHGSITKYDGNNFTLEETNTSIHLVDICGVGNKILVVGYNDQGKSIVLKYHSGIWSSVFESETYFGNPDLDDFGRMSAVGCIDENFFIVSKEGLIDYNYDSDTHKITTSEEANMLGNDFIRISGNEGNDILLVSRNRELVHFNGVTWKRFPIGEDLFLESGYLKDNFVVVGGFLGSFDSAVVIRGYR